MVVATTNQLTQLLELLVALRNETIEDWARQRKFIWALRGFTKNKAPGQLDVSFASMFIESESFYLMHLVACGKVDAMICTDVMETLLEEFLGKVIVIDTELSAQLIESRGTRQVNNEVEVLRLGRHDMGPADSPFESQRVQISYLDHQITLDSARNPASGRWMYVDGYRDQRWINDALTTFFG